MNSNSKLCPVNELFWVIPNRSQNLEQHKQNAWSYLRELNHIKSQLKLNQNDDIPFYHRAMWIKNELIELFKNPINNNEKIFAELLNHREFSKLLHSKATHSQLIELFTSILDEGMPLQSTNKRKVEVFNEECSSKKQKKGS